MSRIVFDQKMSEDVWGSADGGKYRLRDAENNALEDTPDETMDRSCRLLSQNEVEQERWYEEFKRIAGVTFSPGGRIVANALADSYKKNTSLINCIVLPQIPDSMEGIMDIAKQAALLLKAGCGCGYDFSSLRPKGSYVHGAGAATSGIVSFMKVFDAVCDTVMSGGGRRGAQLATLDVQSPEIEDFIKAKKINKLLNRFNMSVLVTDAFMRAVENDETWELWHWLKTGREPLLTDTEIVVVAPNHLPYDYSFAKYFKFHPEHTEVLYGNCTADDVFAKRIAKVVKARELMDIITETTYKYSEPGIQFYDTINRMNPLQAIEMIRTSNACLSGDSVVETTTGSCTIGVLANNAKLFEVLSYNVDTKQVERKTAIAFKTSDDREICEITLYNGYSIKATPDHKLYTERGFVEVKDLKEGDKILTLRRISNKIVEYVEVKAIEKRKNESTYNLTVTDNHNYFANGMLVKNCGEQILPPNGSCLLGSMILVKYVRYPFTPDAYFDLEAFRKDVAVAHRMLDNVVEENRLPSVEHDKYLRHTRRHGLGFTGLGSMFVMLGMRYGSRESLRLAEEIMKTMAQQSLLVSVEVAKEKGSVPAFATEEGRKQFLQTKYIKRVLDSFAADDASYISEMALEFGIRWSHGTSIAPTGTLSIVWGNNCSGGLEPVFAFEYMRNIRVPGKKTKVQEAVQDYAYFHYLRVKEIDSLVHERDPSVWVTSDDLDVDDHLAMQAAIQKWCDSSISKTINIPTDYPIEKFKGVYEKAWKLGLKGLTTFRFNPEVFTGVLVKEEDLKNNQYVFVLENGEEVVARGDEKVFYDGEGHVASNLFDAIKDGNYDNM